MYIKHVSAHISAKAKKNKHKYKVEILKTKETPTSNCWDPNNSKLGTQILSNKKLLPNIYTEFLQLGLGPSAVVHSATLHLPTKDVG